VYFNKTWNDKQNYAWFSLSCLNAILIWHLNWGTNHWPLHNTLAIRRADTVFLFTLIGLWSNSTIYFALLSWELKQKKELTSRTNLKLGHKIGGKPNAISPRLLRSFPHRGPLTRLGWPFLSWIHTKRVNNKTENVPTTCADKKYQVSNLRADT
jgi:hypothetical protein